MKTKFKTQFQKSYKGHPGISMKGQSQTVADQAMSLRQLVINQTRGLGIVANQYEPYYSEDKVLPVITEKLDVVQRGRDLVEELEKLEKEKQLIDKKLNDEKKKKEADGAARKAAETEKTKKGTQPSGD